MAGYRSWGDKDRLTETDVNTYLMGQALPRFSDADERDTQMGGVVPGQVCYLVDVDRYERVSADGTWVDLIPEVETPPQPAVPAVRSGTTTLTGLVTVVSCPGLTETAVILLTAQTVVGVSTPSVLAVGSRSTGSETFTVTASQSADTSIVGWLVCEPTTT